MYYVSTQGIDEHVINVHYYYYYLSTVCLGSSVGVTIQCKPCISYLSTLSKTYRRIVFLIYLHYPRHIVDLSFLFIYII